jgi:hypothetical protein
MLSRMDIIATTGSKPERRLSGLLIPRNATSQPFVRQAGYTSKCLDHQRSVHANAYFVN